MKPKEQKQEEAKKRSESSNNRTPEEQLRRLDEKFGVGIGATKERARLRYKIAELKQSKQKNRDTKDARTSIQKQSVTEEPEADDSTMYEEGVNSSRPRKLGRSMKKKRTKSK